MSSLLTRTHSSPNLKPSLTTISFPSSPYPLCAALCARRTPARTNQQQQYRHNREWESQLDKYGYDAEDEDFYVIGDRVYVDAFKTASVAYFGEVEFASGDWVGIVLDEPTGNHSGKVHGRQYFQCAPFHGLFVRSHRLSRIPDSAFGSSATSSRASTPMPSIHRQVARASKSPGTSTLDSYYYDEDYRPDKKPTVESLARKLWSIEERSNSHTSSQVSRSDSLESPPSKAGILKTRPSRPQSSESASRASELARRARSSSVTERRADKESVFNFRPRREQLNQESPTHDTSDHHKLPPRAYNLDSNYNNNNNSTMYTPSYLSRSQPSLSGGRVSVDLSSEPVRVGDRVSVRTERGTMTGVLRFMGETEFATGEWAGVELDGSSGKNDGSVLGVRYFYCAPNRGLFVPALRVKKYEASRDASGPVFGTMRSTIFSPPPHKSSYSSASSTPNYLDDFTYSASSKRGYSPGSSLASPTAGYHHLSAKSRLDDGYTSSPLRTNNSLLNSSFSTSYQSKYEPEAKFDDADIEYQLKKTLNQSTNPWQSLKVSSGNIYAPKPRSITYTFSSSKYDGNPIARRTVNYN